MKRSFFATTLILMVFISLPASAKGVDKNYSPLFVIPDILIYRPVGLAATAVGVGLFAAISPLTALAQIAPPHDAFEKMSNILILGPGKYTFSRPVGHLPLRGY